MRKTNKGITLVALIITIIVMLILVSVTVSVVINSNLIGTAQNAANSTKSAYANEKNMSIYEYYAIPWSGEIAEGFAGGEGTEENPYIIENGEQLAYFAEQVNNGNTYEGKYVKVIRNINLGNVHSWVPIGNNATFKGVFDGSGKTISNLYISGWDLGYDWDNYGSIGLFGEIENATIKNLNIENSEMFIERSDCAGVTGSATGVCTFENINVSNSKIASCNNGLGGIVGGTGDGTYTFKNINIASDVTLADLYGFTDTCAGGIVGQAEPGATYNFENVKVACRLDVYNDVTSGYDYGNYRMCGMVMGRLEETTVDSYGKNCPDMSKYNITCENVTVTYGEWMNYHYCKIEGERAKRVEPGYTYTGLPADHNHSGSTIVIHNCTIPFDSLFGGAQMRCSWYKNI